MRCCYIYKLNPNKFKNCKVQKNKTTFKTIKHYAKVLDKKVSEDMKLLRDKFSINNAINIKTNS